MSSSAASHPFTDEQIALATSNYESQELMIRRLHDAFLMSELDQAIVAAELGISEEDLIAWLGGEVDLTMSELRQLANSIDAQVTYRVSALRTRYVQKFSALEAHSQWVTTDAWGAPKMVST